jgi:hypothetical protein
MIFTIAHRLAMSISWAMDLGLDLPSSSLRDTLQTPPLKASIALSLEMFVVVFFKIVNRWMYARSDSPCL